MPVVKLPSKVLPWVVIVLCIAALAGLVGIMTDNHIWPFNH
ncbi:MAG TPA: hypothetical protein VHN39_03860 [Phenylobacterium sp.]|jgi:hypothetical protein|nr:hypothetical protein [Phenylobacterium sp.]